MSAPVLGPQTSRFFCAHCHDSDDWFLVFSFETIDDVYGHWLSNHTELPKAKQFLYYAIELVGCYYCHYSGLYDRLRKHHSNNHPDDVFVATRKMNREQCAFCYYIGPNLANHVQQTHQQVLESRIFNPVCYTRDSLRALLAIDIHKKQRCGYCGDIFETEHEATQHHFYEHLGKTKLFYEWRDKDPHQISYIKCGRCDGEIEAEHYYRHVEIDQAIFHTTKRNGDDNKSDPDSEYYAEYFRLYQDYLKTKVIFGNGLICFKQNLIFSDYDDTDAFARTVDRLLNTE